MACAVLSAGPSPAPAADRAPAVSPLAKQLFASYCTQCHGADGKGAPGRAGAGTPAAIAMPEIPDFTNRPWQLSRSNVQLAVSILEGKNQHMPANRGMVNDELARELVAYVRTFAPAPQPAVTKAAPAPAPPRVAAGPAGTPAAPVEVASVPAYTPTGDFDADFDHYLTDLETLQRQVRALASAPAAVSPSPGNPPTATAPAPAAPPAAAPPMAAPPAAEPPAAAPAEAAPPASAPPASPAAPAPEQPKVAALPISDRAFTPDDVARGRELFLGRRPLANGGPACVGCHAINGAEARDGGRLGPDLTKAYERLGGRAALGAHLWAPGTRTMRLAYQRNSLEPDEVLDLMAYLDDADKQAVADTTPQPLRFLLTGLGGAVLGLGVLSALWGARSRRRERAAQNGRPDLAPSSMDCVGAGL
jgi:mono/diheme cytochrome c family protein